jgi:hypothetical protein
MLNKDKEYVIIEKEMLKKLIESAHRWRVVSQNTDILGNLSPSEWDELMLEYVLYLKRPVPKGTSGFKAIEIISGEDIDFFHEVFKK